MKKLMIALAIVAIASVAQAELLSTWGTFTGGNTAVTAVNSSAANYAQVTWSDLSRGGDAMGVQTTAAGNFAANNWTGTGYFYLTATVASGYQIANADIRYTVNGTTTGPGTMAWSLNGTTLNAGHAITSVSGGVAYTDTIPTMAAGVNSLTFDHVGTLNQAGTAAFASGGGIRLLTAVTVNGDIQSTTPVPEPATMGLLGLGALAMILRRKMSK